jgi:hypothetical protein
MNRTVAAHASAQPTLADLMVRFLASRSDAATAAVETTAGGEVEPHEVAAGFRVDPRTAWTDATAALAAGRGNPDSTLTPVPTDWAGLVSQPTAAFAVPLAAGHYPQRVKDLHPLLAKFAPEELRPTGESLSAGGMTGLRSWAGKVAKSNSPAGVLAAAGVTRALGDLDGAEAALSAAESVCDGEWRAAWENERAALLWQRGRGVEALAAWDRMPETVTTLFNRGMALLFLGRPTEARPMLAKAADQLPPNGGWESLARLYLAVAEIHG